MAVESSESVSGVSRVRVSDVSIIVDHKAVVSLSHDLVLDHRSLISCRNWRKSMFCQKGRVLLQFHELLSALLNFFADFHRLGVSFIGMKCWFHHILDKQLSILTKEHSRAWKRVFARGYNRRYFWCLGLTLWYNWGALWLFIVGLWSGLIKLGEILLVEALKC